MQLCITERVPSALGDAVMTSKNERMMFWMCIHFSHSNLEEFQPMHSTNIHKCITRWTALHLDMHPQCTRYYVDSTPQRVSKWGSEWSALEVGLINIKLRNMIRNVLHSTTIIVLCTCPDKNVHTVIAGKQRRSSMFLIEVVTYFRTCGRGREGLGTVK